MTRYGIRELILSFILFGGGGVCIIFLLPDLWYLCFVPFFCLAFVCQFFRDPERKPIETGKTLVCPADGKITDITILDETEYIKGKACRYGIFMDVCSVHVNRSPVSGVVEYVKHHDGKYFDVRDPRALTDNEHFVIGIRSSDPFEGKVTVNLIAGLIARRIVCDLKPGDTVEKGARIGMIKFGSRVEVCISPEVDRTDLVKLGDKVKAGHHVLTRIA